jgi:hypothetical protein
MPCVEDDEHDLAVPRASRADLAIRGVRRDARRVAHGRREDAALLPEFLLGAPEAAHPKKRAPHSREEGRLERMTVDEVLLRDGHFLGAAGKSFAGRWKLELVRTEEHWRLRCNENDPEDPRYSLLPPGGGFCSSCAQKKSGSSG